ncbi:MULTISPECIES: pyruvate carboxyltransferase [unclassified Pseudodesulfovibrio]|uniref:LeuA family protein n=1 Tax=unclassified Pseudodesulfovibrio TaxID=2661612 RepID=UPI000FEB9289|nr:MULTISPECIES: pyruvate carboxyltransferase [unclassified Pseudodesulfovibrio]MCJ2163485.1 pyruvate carboxyltransferase [Pseudodesulfovibrio sp. S3-i]RWU06720.1 pyruvate carboxyltransferase [Pseudodesulfovibrio sp. S3]
MLIDTTLREGAQLFGAYFSMETREKIVIGLLDAGVEEIELGWVGQEDLEELIGRVRPSCGATALSVWCPCREADIRTASRLDIDRVNIGVPISDQHIEHRLGTDREGLLERLARTVFAAGLLGMEYVSVGLEDLSRADTDFALRAARLAQDAGASRVRLSDSLGVLTPLRMAALVNTFAKNLSMDLAVHCHDDFGMATGNAVTALACGAQYADASLLGIGERSGIAATEELAAHLTLKEKSHAYTIEGLRELCHFVSQAAGIPIPRTKSIAGEDIFACESGLHAHALSKFPELFEPYAPETVGADRKVAVGGKSGRAAIKHALADQGRDLPEHCITALVAQVRKLAWKLERPLTDPELSQLIKN